MVYSPRFARKKAALLKIESAYGTLNAPLAADLLLMSNVTFRAIIAQRLSRDLLLPYMGNQGVMLTGYHAQIEADIELAGSGVAGTPPRWGSVLRIGGMTETIDEGVSVTYGRADWPHESGSMYVVIDGNRHVLLGCRANVAPAWSTTAIPRARVTITGLLGTITGQPNPTVSKAGWVTPLPVNKQNTTLSVHGVSSPAESFSFDFGNTVTPRFVIGEEAVLITNQEATGRIVMDAPPLSAIDLYDRAAKRTRGVVSFQHGQQAGNIVQVTQSFVELGAPEHGDSDGVLTYSIDTDICVDAGFDDFSIVVK